MSLIPAYVPVPLGTWTLVSETSNGLYPTGVIQDHDIGIYYAVQNGAGNPTATGFTSLLYFNYVNESTGSDETTVVFGQGTAVVMWRSLLASFSGASYGGSADARTLLVYRYNSPPTAATSVVEVGTEVVTGTATRTYTAAFGSQPGRLIFPMHGYVGLATGFPTCTQDGVSGTNKGWSVGNTRAGVFIGTPQAKQDIDVVFSNPHSGSFTNVAFNIRPPT